MLNNIYEELKEREQDARKDLEFAQKRYAEISLLKMLYEEKHSKEIKNGR